MDYDENSVTPSDLTTKSNPVEKEEECSVCVAVNIRPLIGAELVEGCQECLQVAAEQAQVLYSILLFFSEFALYTR